MRTHSLASFALPLSLAFAACRSAGVPAPEPLAVRALGTVAYEAEVVGHAVRWSEIAPGRLEDGFEPRSAEAERARIEHAVEAHVAREAGAPPPPPPAGDADRPLVEVETRIVRLAPDAAAAALGWSPGATLALCVSRADALALCDDLARRGLATDADVQVSRLLIHPGEDTTVSSVNQVAYVERFALVAGDGTLIADPEVAVADDGILLGARAGEPDPKGRRELALELVVATIQRPIRSQSVALPGALHRVELQTPVTTRQRLTAGANLGADEALVVGGIETPGEEGVLFLIARCAGFERP